MLASVETRGFRFEVGLSNDFDVLDGCGDSEGDRDGGGGDGGLEEGVLDA